MGDEVRDNEMIERTEPKFISFAAGDVCQGVLTAIEKVSVKGKPGVRYTVARTDGTDVCFIGTQVLNRRLRAEDRGHRIEIVCTGEDENVKRGGNCMKTFVVSVSKNRVADVPVISDESAVLEITDSDIPF